GTLLAPREESGTMTRRIWVVGGIVAAAALLTTFAVGMVASSHKTAAGAFHAKVDSDSMKDSPGGGNEGPDIGTAAAEEAAARAFPAQAVPFGLTAHAQKAWAQLKGRAIGRGKNKAGIWTLAGPSSANMPSVLTYSGADYTTSGRITALAID